MSGGGVKPMQLVEVAFFPYRGLFPSPPLFDRMPTYRTQGKRSLNFLSASRRTPAVLRDGPQEKAVRLRP